MRHGSRLIILAVALCLFSPYTYGQNVPRDAQLAQLRKDAEQGNNHAQTILGMMYAEGRGVSRDESKAAEWFRKAANQGNANAQYFLGMMYARGQGVPQDKAKAIEWIRKFVDEGTHIHLHPDAEPVLYSLLLSHEQATLQEKAQAIAWFRKAAEQKGDARAQFTLGIMYLNGQGMPQDKAQAMAWFRKASDQGLPDAMFVLGSLYANENDFQKACPLWKQANELGFTNNAYDENCKAGDLEKVSRK